MEKTRPTRMGLIYAEKRSIYAEKRLNMRRKAQKNAGAICFLSLEMFGVWMASRNARQEVDRERQRIGFWCWDSPSIRWSGWLWWAWVRRYMRPAVLLPQLALRLCRRQLAWYARRGRSLILASQRLRRRWCWQWCCLQSPVDNRWSIFLSHTFKF